jgi:hypothetical protein
VVFATLLVMAGVPAGTAEKLTLRVSPRVSAEPALVRVRATIEKDSENRALAIVAESREYYRSSVVQLEGDRAARITVIEFRRLPAGDYEVSAELFGADGTVRAVVRHSILVSERSSEASP